MSAFHKRLLELESTDQRRLPLQQRQFLAQRSCTSSIESTREEKRGEYINLFHIMILSPFFSRHMSAYASFHDALP